MREISLFGQVKEALKEHPRLWTMIRKEANSFADRMDQEDFLLSILAFIRFKADRTRRGALPKWMIERIRFYQQCIKKIKENEVTVL